MEDLLPLIPPKTGNLPDKKPKTTDDLEIGIYTLGLLAFAVTQYYSKSFPHLAEKTSENIIGPGLKGIEAKPTMKPLPLGASLLPPPLGYISPRRFGLAPNYLNNVEKNLRSPGLGLEVFAPPQTHFLHNLPDNDPRVLIEELEYEAREQLLVVRHLARTRDIDAVFGLYFAARGPDAKKVFVDPKSIEAELEAQLRQRLYGDVGFKQEKVRREILISEKHLPQRGEMPKAIPSPLGEPNKQYGLGDVYLPSTGELMNEIAAGGANRPKDARPISNLMAQAAKGAPPLVKDLESERNDP